MKKRLILGLFIGLLCTPFFSFSQDSIPTAIDVREEKEIKFQEYLFKALSEKSIKNYQKAIENLEECIAILPKNKTIYFEFSKNYLLLNKTIEAKLYIDKALLLEPLNIWMLLHLVAIQKKDRNYNEAIKTQLKIVQQNHRYRGSLVQLYYLNSEFDKALSLISKLENENGLNKKLKQLKNNLVDRNKTVLVKEEKESLPGLIADFEENKSSFSILKKILELAIKNNNEVFYKYSKLAMDLFPAQPFAYLFRGKALQLQNKHQEAIDILESGLDFVIDNPILESQFYTTLAKLYTIINNSRKASEYLEKVKKLKI
tara:strand:- start:14683 stop:15627 length:945 start_codon:yes stop_codon:yes gene_type:complete